MVETVGLEPTMSGRPSELHLLRFVPHLDPACLVPIRGSEGSRTPDLFAASEALSQLSYEPMAGTTGLEPAISGVTGQRGLQLPYVPMVVGSGYNPASPKVLPRISSAS